MKNVNVLKMMLLTLLLTLAHKSILGQEDEKIYSINSFLKVAPDQWQDYIKLEKAWKKIHFTRIEKGEIAGWALYTIPNAGTAAEYNVVATTFLHGTKQLARFYGDYETGDYINGLSKAELELVQNTHQYRDLVREDVYQLRNNMNKSKQIPNIIWFQGLKLKNGYRADDVVKVEKKLMNPMVEKLMDNGDIKALFLYERKLPSGTTSAFDMVRGFGYDDFETMLAYGDKHGAQFAKMNPYIVGTGMTIDDYDIVAHELWKKIDCTCDE